MTNLPALPEREFVHSWDLPDPWGDIETAFSTAGADYRSRDIAYVDKFFIASNNGVWEPGGSVGTELCLFLVGTFADGKWFALEAGNDYTGWGCQDFADIYVGDTLDDVIWNGLTTDGRSALDYPKERQ